MFICNYKIEKDKIRCVGKLLTNLTKNSNNKKEEESPLLKRRWPKKHMTQRRDNNFMAVYSAGYIQIYLDFRIDL